MCCVTASVHQLEGDLEEDPDVSHPAKKCRVAPLDFSDEDEGCSEVLISEVQYSTLKHY